MHVASFPMPEERGDFGVGVTELMRSGDVFVTLFEYGPESLGQPMFAAHGDPAPRRAISSRRSGCSARCRARSAASCSSPPSDGRSASTWWSPAALHLNRLLAQVNKMLAGLEL